MYIHEAIKSRTEERPFITRKVWKLCVKGFTGAIIKILPTDTPDNCIMIGTASRHPSRGWQPSAEDLTADDWEVTKG